MAARGLRFPGGPPCWPRPVGRAFTPAAPSKFKTGNVPAAAGFPGRCKHRPLQRSDITAGPRFARLAAGPSWFVGEGFIPPAGVPAAAGCGGMRASRPTAVRGRVPFPFGRVFAMVCRGGPWPSRGTLPRCGVCGTMQASSPTWVCYNAGPRFHRLAAGPSWFVGEGFIPPAGVPAAAGCGGMRASRPTAAGGRVPFPFGRAFAMICRGGPWPSRGTLHRHRPRGTISGLRAGPVARLASETRLRAQCKHRPLHGFVITRGRVFPGWPRACRGS